MSTPLLQTKLYQPPLRPNLVPRQRLIHKLNDRLLGERGIFARKLTLISAPAGFGKTTLLLQWLDQLKIVNGELPIGNDLFAIHNFHVTWLSLDDDDNDPTRFLTYLVAAAQRSDPGLAGGATAMLRSPKPQPAEPILITLINDIAESNPRTGMLAADGVDSRPSYLLVLDDYHVIENRAVHDAVTFLLDNMPANSHLAITTRADPPLPLPRLRGRGQLLELRQADLRFTAGEASNFLNQSMGLGLTAGDVTALARTTEGWIAGLQMAAIAVKAHDEKDQSDIHRFIGALDQGQRHIWDYLAEEVLQRQPESIQDFLLKTSILDRLTGSLCDGVMGHEDGRTEFALRREENDIAASQRPPFPASSSMLQSLERANLFVIPLDERGEWYRYHHLFAQMMRRQLQQEQPRIVPELHRRASRWYRQNGFMGRAIDHAFAAGDIDLATELIEESMEAILMHSQMATFLGWADALPEDALQTRPKLAVYRAGVMLIMGRALEQVETALEEAESIAAGAVDGEAAAFRAMIAIYQGDGQRSVELLEKALALLPAESLFLRDLVFESLGIAHLMRGDTDAAMRSLDEAIKMSKATGNVMGIVVTMCNVAGINLAEGQLRQSGRLFEEALALAEDDRGRRLPVAGRALMGLGEVARYRYENEAATQYLLEGIELLDYYGGYGVIAGLSSLAMIYNSQGNSMRANETIHKAQELAVAFDASEMDDILAAAVQVRLWITHGELELAWGWAEERGLLAIGEEIGLEQRPNTLMYDLREIEQIILARLYLAGEQFEEAMNVLRPLLVIAQKRGRYRRVIELLILQALAFQGQNRSDDALGALGQALSFAAREGFKSLFLDEGRPMAQLLYEAASQGIEPAFAGELLTSWKAESTGKGQEVRREITGDGQESIIEPLSDRELEVLQLIAEGLTNQEIAQRLIISLSTVKGHTGNIYGKLNVKNRNQAQSKARELGIL